MRLSLRFAARSTADTTKNAPSDCGGRGGRADRLRRLRGKAELIPECNFGARRFLEIAVSRDFDVLCHHAAEVGDYRNPDFDIAGAVAKNTLNLRDVLTAMRQRGLKGVVLTG